MDTKEFNKEIIERYLMGRLSLWELSDIETKIKNDSVFADEVSFQRDIMIGINESKRLELKQTLQNLKPAGILVRLNVDSDSVKKFAVAASILLLVGLGICYPQIRNATIENSKKSVNILK